MTNATTDEKKHGQSGGQSRRRRGFGQGSSTEPLTEAKLYGALLRALTRRDHTQSELTEKFGSRVSEAALEEALERLVADGYQSDERFTEMFVRSRLGRGQGPLRIRGELRQRGCSQELIEAYVDSAGIDWLAQAKAALQKRFGLEIIGRKLETAAFARAGRFLAARGFPSEIIYRALNDMELEGEC